MIAARVWRGLHGCHGHPVTSIRAMCVNVKVELKEQILRQSFTHVVECGWTNESLLRGIKDLGLSPLTHTIVDRGAVEIVEYFLKEKNKHVKELFTKTHNESATTPDTDTKPSEALLYQVIEAHFNFIRPCLSTWHNALALLAEPNNVASSLELMASTVDDICILTNIKTSRLDWYYERSLLLFIFSSTELYMLTDKSTDLSDTKAYLKQTLQYYNYIRG